MKCDAYKPLHTAPNISPSATPLWRAYQNFAGDIYSFSHHSIQKSEAKASNCVWNFWKLRIKNGAMVEFGFFCAWRTSLCQACRKKHSDKERKKKLSMSFSVVPLWVFKLPNKLHYYEWQKKLSDSGKSSLNSAELLLGDVRKYSL